MALTLIEKLQRLIFGDPDNRNYGAANGDYKVISDLTVMQKMRELAGIGEGDATHLYPKWNNTLKTYVPVTDADFGDKDGRIPDGTTTGDMIAWNSVTQVYDKKTVAEVKTALGIPDGTVDNDFMVWDEDNGVYIKKTPAEVLAILGVPEPDSANPFLISEASGEASVYVQKTLAELFTLLGLIGDATHLYPQWDNVAGKFAMLTQAEMVSALGLGG
ncbi:MAG: hypothetical protein WC358_07015 [Ignavibacteria bacterium]|jgi:hypothetical protein